ncbi:16611_t:CDS:2 [Cetraspora pellucida]|uniref:16611_t:CDS:1 n=1 Tax=Cetraspora pellucida TaxID=1433469 RepID=A0A9N9A6X8_9GLOM|nr:16611_t:CDS:2 [Cetraspora pellucida]
MLPFCGKRDQYDKHKLYLFKWDGSIILNVLPPSLFTTIVAVVVCFIYNHYHIDISIHVTVTPVLAIVVGLLLTYRTNTAYDRQGKRLWSTMKVALRGLTRHIWINVDPKSTKDSLEKETAINLLIGFAFSVKHYLREEGIEYDDLKPFISNIGNIGTVIPESEPLEEQEDKVLEKDKKKNPKIEIKTFKWIINKLFKTKKQRQPIKNYNLPLTITFYLTSYVDKQFNNKIIDQPTTQVLFNNLNALIDCLSGFERILRTPIPMAYAIHLSQTVWIYCISLSFQLVSLIHYVTIPAVLISSIILFGIEAIGEEIENPFGYDHNDLDLDGLCENIKEEIETITKHSRPTGENWVYDHTTSMIEIKEKLSRNSYGSTLDGTLYEDEISPYSDI